MKMKKFKTVQKFCAFLLENIDQVMQEQSNVAGKIESTLCKSEVENTIREYLNTHNEIKHIYNVNNNEIYFSIVCNGSLRDLPGSYKWAKNYVYFRIGKKDNDFYFYFDRDSYRKNAPKKYEISSNLVYKENQLLKAVFDNI